MLSVECLVFVLALPLCLFGSAVVAFRRCRCGLSAAPFLRFATPVGALRAAAAAAQGSRCKGTQNPARVQTLLHILTLEARFSAKPRRISGKRHLSPITNHHLENKHTKFGYIIYILIYILYNQNNCLNSRGRVEQTQMMT